MAALRLNGRWLAVDSLEHAAKLVDEDRRASGIGSTAWYDEDPHQGEVRVAGKKIGHVSYNGRVWPVGA